MSAFPNDEELDQRLAHVRAVLLADLPRQRRRWWRRPGVRVGVVAASAFALAAGGLAIQQASHDEVRHSVVCFEHASTESLSGTVVAPMVSASDGSGSGVQPTVDPIAWCGDVWRWGMLGQATPPADPNAANFPVPDLFACRGDSGVAWVFPREGASASDNERCAALKLAPWPTSGK